MDTEPGLRSVLSGLPASQLSELVRVLPELLVEHPELRVPPPLSEGWQRHHFFEALARAVLGGPRPLLLLIDDLQWCDQETVEWLHYLLRLERKTQLLVAGTARIEDLNNHHPLRSLIRELDREGCSTEIPLELLSSKDTAFLAAQVSERQLEPEFIAELYNQTEGNPLFVIESIRAAQITSGEYLSVKTESETAQKAVPLPPKVHAVLSARLAQLSPKAQELTSLAACIGTAFTAELLARAGHSGEDALVSLLDELWQRRIIKVQGDDSYDFSHDKLREVAYAELSPARLPGFFRLRLIWMTP